MPEEKVEPEKIEVDKPVMQEGNVNIWNKAGFDNPAPQKLKRVFTAIRYFCVGLITAVSATDLLSGYQVKVTCFILGVIILALGAFELGTGVKPIEDNAKGR